MIDVAKLRQSKGRRIYLFWLDKETGEITDVTSRDDVRQVILCKDCKYFYKEERYCVLGTVAISDGYCYLGERKEE